jgi:hypothetical protein
VLRPKPPIPLESLIVEPMDSGDLSLRLTRRVTWEDFARYARAIVSLLGGSIDERADSPVERVWVVTIRGAPFWLSFDDFGLGVSLDARSSAASSLIPILRDELLSRRGSLETAG